ncbi:hypothetical protein CEB3_c36050 [Peptococcaceae bacterium CEB3]|nr:hypothetical protein CEB3_c36050 [Peptococcaceae bacterium CEB3]
MLELIAGSAWTVLILADTREMGMNLLDIEGFLR